MSYSGTRNPKERHFLTLVHCYNDTLGMNSASKLFVLQETKIYPSHAYYRNALDKYMQFHVILSRQIS